MLPLRFVRLREAACAFGFSVGERESSRGFVLFCVFSIPGGVTKGRVVSPVCRKRTVLNRGDGKDRVTVRSSFE
jgi:hypothetical protein